MKFIEIVTVERERLVKEHVSTFRCTVCAATFDKERDAEQHASTHAPLRYFHPQGYGGVWVTADAIFNDCINHMREGVTPIEWEGPGWYVMHRYVTYRSGEPDEREKFITVARAIALMREKFDELAQDWRYFHELRKTEEPPHAG